MMREIGMANQKNSIPFINNLDIFVRIETRFCALESTRRKIQFFSIQSEKADEDIILRATKRG